MEREQVGGGRGAQEAASPQNGSPLGKNEGEGGRGSGLLGRRGEGRGREGGGVGGVQAAPVSRFLTSQGSARLNSPLGRNSQYSGGTPLEGSRSTSAIPAPPPAPPPPLTEN